MFSKTDKASQVKIINKSLSNGAIASAQFFLEKYFQINPTTPLTQDDINQFGESIRQSRYQTQLKGQLMGPYLANLTLSLLEKHITEFVDKLDELNKSPEGYSQSL